MDFGLTGEQRMLQASVSGYLASACALARVREAAAACDTKPADVWEGLAQLGVQGIVTPENHGGVGLSMLEAALIAESLGAAAAPMPFAASCVMAPIAADAGGQRRATGGVAAAHRVRRRGDRRRADRADRTPR